MKNSAASEDNVVPDLRVPREEAIVCNHIAISECYVVPEMCAAHQEISVSDDGRCPLFSAAMNGHVFPERVVVANDHLAGNRRIVREILRTGTNDTPESHQVSMTQSHAIRENRVRLNRAVVSDLDVIFNDGEGADFNI
jgi:hypothetical protein